MDGMLRANYFDSFKKNNVRKDINFNADSFFLEPACVPPPPPPPPQVIKKDVALDVTVTPTSGLNSSLLIHSELKNNFAVVTFENKRVSSHLIRTDIPQSALIKGYNSNYDNHHHIEQRL
jgi:hypothetical protein